MLYVNQPFSKKFCAELKDRCLQAIAAGQSINLVAMPGVGVTFFVRHLEQCSDDTFISVNSFETHELNKAALYNQLARKLGLVATPAEQVDLQAISTALQAHAQGGKRVVLVFNRLDRLGPILDQGFYENLGFLHDDSAGKVVMLLVTAEPLLQLSSPVTQALLRLVASVLYLPGYTLSDLSEIMSTSGSKDLEPAALELSGGHHALLQILLRCQNLDNPLADPMVELIIKDMYSGLSPKHQRTIADVAAGRRKQIDPFLTDVGYIVSASAKPQTFTPLLAAYALQQGSAHLPVRERRLFNFLRRNPGRIVGKAEIFDAVWREADGIASDWALNALIYRLRHHPGFDAQRYTIESYKKQGYMLRDHHAL